MSITLTPETLRACYDFLCTTEPYRRWNLPDGDDVHFRVVSNPAVQGLYWWDTERRQHAIAISRRCIGHTDSLVKVMAHEMIHVHEQHAGACTVAEHSRAFNRWAAQVCKVHGWDVKGF